MRRYLVVIALILSGLFGCASTSLSGLSQSYQIPLRVENNISERMTIYVTQDGRIIQRIGDCNGVQTCTFLLSEQVSNYAIGNSRLEIGYRHFGEPGRGPEHYVSTPAWDGMQANLVVNYINNYLLPYTVNAG